MRDSATLQYFRKLFPAASLAGSVELAANQLRGGMFGHLVPIPVDVEAIAAEHGITIMSDQNGNGPEGELIPRRRGFTIRIRGSGSKMRRRFSIAHEIAHTLFYADEGTGNRHRVALLSRAELEAEELLCNAVAGALLIPRVNLHREVQRLRGGPGELLFALESIARKFQVSFPALIRALDRINVRRPNALVACIHLSPNLKTGQDPEPRILAARVVGQQSRYIWMWSNRSAAKAGFVSGAALLARWQGSVSPEEANVGRFVLEAGEIVRPETANTYPLARETLEVSTHRRGEWRRAQISSDVAYCLYALGGNRRDETYVVAIADLNAPGAKPRT